MDEFTSYRLNEAGFKAADEVTKAFEECLAKLDAIVTGSGDPWPPRERALVVTKLQEAQHFAKRAIASHPRSRAKEHRFFLDEDTTYCRDCHQEKHEASVACPGRGK